MNTVLNFLNSQQPRTSTRPKGYQEAREVKAGAAVAMAGASSSQRKAVSRLDRLLDVNRPLRKDVPRGSYINIKV